MKVSRLHYPVTVKDFKERFATEKKCVDYLIRCRWPDGFVCPSCQSKKSWHKAGRRLLVCQRCRKETSPTAGTLMHRSHLPIQAWFWAAYLVSTITPGMSAVQLQRQLGIGSYQTAWFLLKRLRKGMVNESRSCLSGLIEADECFVGGPAKGRKGRGITADTKVSLVLGAVEIESFRGKGGIQEKARRLRLHAVGHADKKTIGSFLERNVEKNSIVRTDGWRGYSRSALSGYRHEKRPVGQQPAHLLAPHIHRVFSNLKTWLQGTHHGVHPKYLQEYLDEYVFRFNRRQTPMAAFQTLLGITTAKRPLTLKQIMGVK